MVLQTNTRVLTPSFGPGVAAGSLASGVLFDLGSFESPFFSGAAVSVLAFGLVYSQAEETLGRERSIRWNEKAYDNRLSAFV